MPRSTGRPPDDPVDRPADGADGADDAGDAAEGAADLSGRRFLTLADVAEILATSVAQVRSLVQANELRYIQIGGRQQYRIEAVELERYIQRKYAEADAKANRAPR